MKFTIARDRLLKALQLATGVVERRQTLPVLANPTWSIKARKSAWATLTTTSVSPPSISGKSFAGRVARVNLLRPLLTVARSPSTLTETSDPSSKRLSGDRRWRDRCCCECRPSGFARFDRPSGIRHGSARRAVFLERHVV